MAASPQESRNPTPVCVITGGTSGIGIAIVRLLAKKGWLIATCGREPGRLEAVRKELNGHDDRHFVQQVDLADIEQTRQFASTVEQDFGSVDLLVNNAADAPLVPFEEISDGQLESLINVNLRTPFILTRKFWKSMKEKGRGVIVNISSLAAVDPFPGFSIYGASKAWNETMTVALASEGEPSGIRVYSIRAGAVETPLLRSLFPEFPLEQCVSPGEVARQVWSFIAQPGQWPSGSCVVVSHQP